VNESIRDLEQNVHTVFLRALALAKCAKSQRFGEIERSLWSTLLELGRALVAVFLSRQAARPRGRSYVHDGVEYELDLRKPRTTEVGTRFGKVRFVRPVGRRAGWRSRSTVDLPVDRELGLCGGFSLETMTTLTYLCTLLAFDTARRAFASFCEWMPSPRGTLRIVDAIGKHARGFLESAPPPEDDGEILVIQVDGRGAPMIGTREYGRRTKPRNSTTGTRRSARRGRRRAYPRERRQSGERSKNAKVANLAVLYTLRRTDAGLEGPLNKRIIGTFDGLPKLFAWLVAEATKRGYGKKRTIFLADGDPNIWRHQTALLPDVDACIDWYHVVEKLWEVGESLYGTATNSSNAEARRAWVGRQTRRLREGRPDLIIAELRKLHREIANSGPGSRAKRERLRTVTNYIVANSHRMHYHLLRDDDLDIATGAAEGAVRNVIGVRLDGPGMRWGRDRAELLLHLRCIHASGLWSEFARSLQSRTLRLLPSPIPTRPHDAKAHVREQRRDYKRRRRQKAREAMLAA
jgi:hypothetical protein